MIIESETLENSEQSSIPSPHIYQPRDTISEILSKEIPKTKVIVRKRPLNQKEISQKEVDNITIEGKNKVQIFIDDIISNKKINNLLFEGNAKKELAFFFRQQNAVLKNMNYVKSYNSNKKKESLSEIAEIFLKKKNDLVFNQESVENLIGQAKEDIKKAKYFDTKEQINIDLSTKNIRALGNTDPGPQ